MDIFKLENCMVKVYRPCPSCVSGKVEIKEIPSGAWCSYRHKNIEVNVVYSVGLPILLAIIVGLSFKYSFDLVGYLTTVVLGLHSIFMTNNTKYFPLTSYEK